MWFCLSILNGLPYFPYFSFTAFMLISSNFFSSKKEKKFVCCFCVCSPQECLLVWMLRWLINKHMDMISFLPNSCRESTRKDWSKISREKACWLWLLTLQTSWGQRTPQISSVRYTDDPQPINSVFQRWFPQLLAPTFQQYIDCWLICFPGQVQAACWAWQSHIHHSHWHPWHPPRSADQEPCEPGMREVIFWCLLLVYWYKCTYFYTLIIKTFGSVFRHILVKGCKIPHNNE